MASPANEQRDIVVLRVEAPCQHTGEQEYEEIELDRKYLKTQLHLNMAGQQSISLQEFVRLAAVRVAAKVLGIESGSSDIAESPQIHLPVPKLP